MSVHLIMEVVKTPVLTMEGRTIALAKRASFYKQMDWAVDEYLHVSIIEKQKYIIQPEIEMDYIWKWHYSKYNGVTLKLIPVDLKVFLLTVFLY